MNSYCFLSSNPIYNDVFRVIKERGNENWFLISNQNDFTIKFLKKGNISKIFIPHWSNIIPRNIYEQFECIVFHMTDLPYGRGGSPLQNLIIRGHKKTKLSALRVNDKIDAGPIYLKKELSLKGTATQIFQRASKIIMTMIIEIIEMNKVPKEQKGTPVIFRRRNSEDSNMKDLKTLEEVFDYIRMLDCEGYPNAFIETSHFKFHFTKAKIQNNQLIKANVEIIKK